MSTQEELKKNNNMVDDITSSRDIETHQPYVDLPLSKTVNISISIDRDVLEALIIGCSARNISRSKFIERALLKDKLIDKILSQKDDDKDFSYSGSRTVKKF